MIRLDAEARRSLLRDMVFVRRFEERCAQLYQQTTIRGFLHLSLRSGGIIVPTIERANELSPAAMMQRMVELVQQARQGRLRRSHLGEASITVTNLGDRGPTRCSA